MICALSRKFPVVEFKSEEHIRDLIVAAKWLELPAEVTAVLTALKVTITPAGYPPNLVF